jgi:hypothetical protein
MKNLTIRLADKSEIDKAFSLLRGAAIWLRDKGIDHWQNWINPSDLYSNWIKEGFDSNQFYFVMHDLQVIACSVYNGPMNYSGAFEMKMRDIFIHLLLIEFIRDKGLVAKY